MIGWLTARTGPDRARTGRPVDSENPRVAVDWALFREVLGWSRVAVLIKAVLFLLIN